MLTLGKFLYNIIVGDVKIDVNIFNKTAKQWVVKHLDYIDTK